MKRTLEAELIKRLEPPYNTEGKDDKSYNCVAITDEDFPRVLVVRQRDMDSGKLKIACPPKPLRRRRVN